MYYGSACFGVLISALWSICCANIQTLSQMQTVTRTHNMPRPMSNSVTPPIAQRLSASRTLPVAHSATRAVAPSGALNDEAVFDNTDGRTRSIAPATARLRALFDVSSTLGYIVLQPYSAYALSFAFGGQDAACGSGFFVLTTFTLAVSSLSSGVGAVVINISLWRAFGVEANNATLLATTAVPLKIDQAPAYSSMLLPAEFRVDAAADLVEPNVVAYLVTMEVTIALRWHYILAADDSQTISDVLEGRCGAAIAALWSPSCSDGSGSSVVSVSAALGNWADIGGFPGVRLGAIMTPSSASASFTRSMSISTASSTSGSRPGSQSRSRTPSWRSTRAALAGDGPVSSTRLAADQVVVLISVTIITGLFLVIGAACGVIYFCKTAELRDESVEGAVREPIDAPALASIAPPSRQRPSSTATAASPSPWQCSSAANAVASKARGAPDSSGTHPQASVLTSTVPTGFVDELYYFIRVEGGDVDLEPQTEGSHQQCQSVVSLDRAAAQATVDSAASAEPAAC